MRLALLILPFALILSAKAQISATLRQSGAADPGIFYKSSEGWVRLGQIHPMEFNAVHVKRSILPLLTAGCRQRISLLQFS